MIKFSDPFSVACVASVSVGLGEKNEEQESKTARKVAQVKEPLFYFLALVSFLARSKPKVPFLGISLFRNQTDTLATQATFSQPNHSLDSTAV